MSSAGWLRLGGEVVASVMVSVLVLELLTSLTINNENHPITPMISQPHPTLQNRPRKCAATSQVQLNKTDYLKKKQLTILL